MRRGPANARALPTTQSEGPPVAFENVLIRQEGAGVTLTRNGPATRTGTLQTGRVTRLPAGRTRDCLDGVTALRSERSAFENQ